MKNVSVGIPILNEAEVIPALIERVVKAFPKDGKVALHEIIFVNDGSTDASAVAVQMAMRKNPRIKLISFTRNFGHQMAISAAIEYASGDALVVMDGDLQDPPELIPLLADAWLEGADVVYAQRSLRNGEGWWKRANATVYYRLLRALSDTDIPVDAGDFCLMDTRVVAVLRAMPEHTRYLRGLRAWTGFRAVGVAYERVGRATGASKYSLKKMFGLGANGIIAFSLRPLRLASWLGFITFFASVVAGILVVYMKYRTDLLIPGWASIVIPVFALGGIQLLVAGILGEYIGRLYEEVRGRPLYVIREKIGFEKTE